jgi:hypothetical protein
MFGNGKKYMTATVLLVLFAAGFATALRPGITIVKDTGEIYVNAHRNQETTEEPTTPQIIGGDTDAFGCLTPAGFSWNATIGKCIRPWSGEIQLASGTMMVNVSDPNWREKLTISTPIPKDIKCFDTDNGNIYVKGSVFEQGKNVKKDSCRHSKLTEWSCVKGRAEQDRALCKKGCKDGACIPEIVEQTVPSPKLMPPLEETSEETTLPNSEL